VVPDTLEQEVPLEQLSDIKAKSIIEWIANDRVRRSIIKHFRQFLMTYVDDHGASVYGQRIRNLGESTCFLAFHKIGSLNTLLLL
jgi:DNA replication licensing factor MCM2